MYYTRAYTKVILFKLAACMQYKPIYGMPLTNGHHRTDGRAMWWGGEHCNATARSGFGENIYSSIIRRYMFIYVSYIEYCTMYVSNVVVYIIVYLMFGWPQCDPPFAASAKCIKPCAHKTCRRECTRRTQQKVWMVRLEGKTKHKKKHRTRLHTLHIRSPTATILTIFGRSVWWWPSLQQHIHIYTQKHSKK